MEVVAADLVVRVLSLGRIAPHLLAGEEHVRERRRQRTDEIGRVVPLEHGSVEVRLHHGVEAPVEVAVGPQGDVAFARAVIRVSAAVVPLKVVVQPVEAQVLEEVARFRDEEVDVACRRAADDVSPPEFPVVAVFDDPSAEIPVGDVVLHLGGEVGAPGDGGVGDGFGAVVMLGLDEPGVVVGIGGFRIAGAVSVELLGPAELLDVHTDGVPVAPASPSGRTRSGGRGLEAEG